MTALERIAPHMAALAAEVIPGQKIRYRDKTYWLGDLQLTYSTETTDGKVRELGGPTSAENVALAERLLRKCLAAREQPAWGSRWDRQRRILVGLREDVCPTFRPHHFCHWRHESFDDGALFRASLSPRYHASIRLVGEDDSPEGEGLTLEGAVEALWAKLAPAGERPPWHGKE